jgi:hypothetical protein
MATKTDSIDPGGKKKDRIATAENPKECLIAMAEYLRWRTDNDPEQSASKEEWKAAADYVAKGVDEIAAQQIAPQRKGSGGSAVVRGPSNPPTPFDNTPGGPKR